MREQNLLRDVITIFPGATKVKSIDSLESPTLIVATVLVVTVVVVAVRSEVERD